VKRSGRRCSRRWSRDSPAAHDEDHGEACCPPAAHGGPHTGAGGCLKEAVTPWGAGAGAGLLAGLVTPWGAHTGADHEEPAGDHEQPAGRTHVGEVCGELSPMGETPHWSRGRV